MVGPYLFYDALKCYFIYIPTGVAWRSVCRRRGYNMNIIEILCVGHGPTGWGAGCQREAYGKYVILVRRYVFEVIKPLELYNSFH